MTYVPNKWITYVLTNVINSVPFQPERTEFLVLAWKLEQEYTLFHLGSNSGPFRPILGNFGRNEFCSLLSLHAAMFWLFWVPPFLFYLTASNIIKKNLQQWAERRVKNREWPLMILLRWITHETSSFTYLHFALCSTKPQSER